MDNTQKDQHRVILCPECDTPVKLPENVSLGKVLECSSCGTESEIVTVNPINLAPLEEEK